MPRRHNGAQPSVAIRVFNVYFVEMFSWKCTVVLPYLIELLPNANGHELFFTFIQTLTNQVNLIAEIYIISSFTCTSDIYAHTMNMNVYTCAHIMHIYIHT